MKKKIHSRKGVCFSLQFQETQSTRIVKAEQWRQETMVTSNHRTETEWKEHCPQPCLSGEFKSWVLAHQMRLPNFTWIFLPQATQYLIISARPTQRFAFMWFWILSSGQDYRSQTEMVIKNVLSLFWIYCSVVIHEIMITVMICNKPWNIPVLQICTSFPGGGVSKIYCS